MEAGKKPKVDYTVNNNTKLENLPDHVIHQIMYLLPSKEAAKFSVLSKSFYSTWLSLPTLHIEISRRRMKYDSLRPVFSSQILTVLRLAGVRVPLVDAFITCPKLEELLFRYCDGFQAIHVSSSSSLKRVKLKSCRQLEACQILLEGKSLNNFRSEGHQYDDLRQCALVIDFCRDLKVLKLTDATVITDKFDSSLKKLSLYILGYEQIEILIDAPNLLEFYYVPRIRELPKLITSAKCSANISLIPPFLPYTHDGSLLRNFLCCCSNQFKDLTITCWKFELIICPKLPSQPVNVSSLYDLRHLKLEATDDTLPRDDPYFLILLLKSLLKMFKYGKKVEMTNLKVGECCYNVPVKCWRHYEVEIEFQGFNESERENLN
ncbi:uncharacterized protein LOC114763187, partial [Neltuma alba]|uniref:uncharacterized protein LOC114763187 n=1 Tax=Neltuma alba TaxID=207710 RepID=UPI0010A56A9A